MTSGQPCQEEFGPSRREKIVKHCPDFPPQLQKKKKQPQMFRRTLKTNQLNTSWRAEYRFLQRWEPHSKTSKLSKLQVQRTTQALILRFSPFHNPLH